MFLYRILLDLCPSGGNVSIICVCQGFTISLVDINIHLSRKCRIVSTAAPLLVFFFEWTIIYLSSLVLFPYIDCRVSQIGTLLQLNARSYLLTFTEHNGLNSTLNSMLQICSGSRMGNSTHCPFNLKQQQRNTYIHR